MGCLIDSCLPWCAHYFRQSGIFELPHAKTGPGHLCSGHRACYLLASFMHQYVETRKSGSVETAVSPAHFTKGMTSGKLSYLGREPFPRIRNSEGSSADRQWCSVSSLSLFFFFSLYICHVISSFFLLFLFSYSSQALPPIFRF